MLKLLKCFLSVAGAVAVCALLVHPQTAVQSATIQAGLYSAMPANCGANALYLAVDQPAGQQLEVCKDGTWYPLLNLGGSGALTLEGGTLDINPSVIPQKNASQNWAGANTFSDLRLTTSQGKTCTAETLNRLVIDTSNPQFPQLKICLLYQGSPAWRYLYAYGADGW